MFYSSTSSLRNHKTVNSKPLSYQIITNQQKQHENSKKSLSSIDNNISQNQQIPQIPQITQNALKRQWTQQEDNLVYNLHNQYGNKWAIIADSLKQRTDNCVKNHFYSRLRKGLRKINKIIDEQFKKKFKQFKMIDLYKIIQASDQKFKQVKSFTNQMTDLGLNLKNRLFIFAEEQYQQNHNNQEYQRKTYILIEDISEFTKNYKRKSKKSRRYSPMGIDSIYRANAKKFQTQSLQKIQAEKSQFQSQSKKSQKNKIETLETVNINDDGQKYKKMPQNKQAFNLIDKDLVYILKKQGLMDNHNEINNKSKSKGKDYRHFSDDQDEDKNEAEYAKQQRLNLFAQNLLKTFKSYYSYKSFKSNPVLDDPFFQ